MRGRKPKPTALKILAGNPGKRALPRGEPKATGPAVMPKWLSRGAVKVWNDLAPEQVANGVLRAGGEEAFGMLCTEMAVYRANSASMTSSEKALLTRLISEFGMTPSSSTRIAVKPAKPADDERRFFGIA